MHAFNYVVGESLRIGDVARIHVRSVVRSSDEDEVWLEIEWSGKERALLEIMPSEDPEQA